MNTSRVTIFAGHYGSGKTNVAVNYALWLRQSRPKVMIADLDIVNPYFRTKDSAGKLQAAGVKLLSSDTANSNVDAPSVPGEINSIFDDTEWYSVIDVGGDDRGAFALGRYHERLLKDSVSSFLVVNMYRPLSRDVEATLEIMREIETAARLKFTGMINNSNLGPDTTAADIINSIPYAEEISRETKLPIVMTSVTRSLAPELEASIHNLFPIDLEEYVWQKSQK
ncbi:MAG: hypothetical protein GX434_10025 [Peptococcaceae bacterium]|nr:hypothetical protein [Peptococcaceae bacterium]